MKGSSKSVFAIALAALAGVLADSHSACAYKSVAGSNYKVYIPPEATAIQNTRIKQIEECADISCVRRLVQMAMTAAGTQAGEVAALKRSAFAVCDAEFGISAGKGIKCMETQLSALGESEEMPLLASARSQISSGVLRGSEVTVPQWIAAVIAKKCGNFDSTDPRFDLCMLSLLDSAYANYTAAQSKLAAAATLVSNRGTALAACGKKFAASVCAEAFGNSFGDGFTSGKMKPRTLLDAVAAPGEPELAGGVLGGVVVGGDALALGDPAPKKVDTGPSPKDLGGVGSGFSASNTYLTEINRCLDNCRAATSCQRDSTVIDAQFATICALKKGAVPIGQAFDASMSDTDMIGEYFDELRVSGINQFIKVYGQFFGEQPDLSGLATCKRLAPKLVYPALPPIGEPSSWPKELTGAALESYKGTMRGLILQEMQKYCVDDPDPEKGIYWRSLVKMPGLSGDVLKRKPQYAAVQDCAIEGLKKDNKYATRTGVAFSTVCLAFAFTKFLPAQTVCNLGASALAVQQIDIATAEYKTCFDRAGLDPCGKERKIEVQSNLRYAKLVGMITVAASLTNTAAVGAGKLASGKAAILLTRLSKLKDVLPPSKFNELLIKVWNAINLEVDSDYVGKSIAATDLANFHAWGAVQEIIDKAASADL